MNEELDENYDEKMSLSELNLYLNLLEQQLNKIFSDKDYDEIITKIKYEFNIKVTKEKLDLLFNGDLYEETMSRELIYRNIFG